MDEDDGSDDLIVEQMQEIRRLKERIKELENEVSSLKMCLLMAPDANRIYRKAK